MCFRGMFAIRLAILKLAPMLVVFLHVYLLVRIIPSSCRVLTEKGWKNALQRNAHPRFQDLSSYRPLVRSRGR